MFVCRTNNYSSMDSAFFFYFLREQYNKVAHYKAMDITENNSIIDTDLGLSRESEEKR